MIYGIIILVCVCVSVKVSYASLLYASAKPDKLYVEMNEINESQTLIGISNEEVVELLGEPDRMKEDDVYYYDAGKVTNYLFFGERDFYELRIVFDQNDIVNSISMEMIT